MNRSQIWYVQGAAYRLNRQLVETGAFIPEDTEDAQLYYEFMTEWDQIEPLTEELRAYRGIGFGQHKMGQGGFASASLDEEEAKSFVDYTLATGQYTLTGELLILDIQPGVRVMHVGGVQQEIIIEPNVEVEITRTVKLNGKRDKSTVIWMTVKAA